MSKRIFGVLNFMVLRLYLENVDYMNYLFVMMWIFIFVMFGWYLWNNNSGKFDLDINFWVNNFVDYILDMNSDKIVLSWFSLVR